MLQTLEEKKKWNKKDSSHANFPGSSNENYQKNKNLIFLNVTVNYHLIISTAICSDLDSFTPLLWAENRKIIFKLPVAHKKYNYMKIK